MELLLRVFRRHPVSLDKIHYVKMVLIYHLSWFTELVVVQPSKLLVLFFICDLPQ